MPSPSWQVDHVVPAGGFVVLFGPSGVGKSFASIDLAMSIGCGLPWHGRLTEPGLCVYVSAEGTAGLGQRIKAWLTYRDMKPSDINAMFVTEAVPMHTESEYLAFLLQRFDEIQGLPKLVILDTLARNFVGDENETEDMSAFVAAVDKLRFICDCTVIAIHHTNVSEGRERGNGALRAASDTMIRMAPGILGARAGANDKRFTLTCEKQKEAIDFAPGLGQIVSVETGRRPDGRVITSGVCDIYEWLKGEGEV